MEFLYLSKLIVSTSHGLIPYHGLQITIRGLVPCHGIQKVFDIFLQFISLERIPHLAQGEYIKIRWETYCILKASYTNCFENCIGTHHAYPYYSELQELICFDSLGIVAGPEDKLEPDWESYLELKLISSWTSFFSFTVTIFSNFYGS